MPSTPKGFNSLRLSGVAILAVTIGALLSFAPAWHSACTNLTMLHAIGIYRASSAGRMPDSIDEPQVYVDVPFAHGIALIAMGQWDEAHFVLSRAAGSNPVLAFWLGNAELQRGAKNEAIEAWREAGSALYWAWKSQEAAQAGDGELANELAMRARQIAPDDPEVHYLVGSMYFNQQEWKDAADALNTALAAPVSSAEWYYDALMLRGQVFSREPGNLNLAQVDFEQAMSLRRGDPWPYLRLCQAFGVNGKAEESVTACRQGLALAGDSALAHYYMGWALYHARRWDEARSEFRTSISLDPDLQAAQDWLARVEDRK